MNPRPRSFGVMAVALVGYPWGFFSKTVQTFLGPPLKGMILKGGKSFHTKRVSATSIFPTLHAEFESSSWYGWNSLAKPSPNLLKFQTGVWKGWVLKRKNHTSPLCKDSWIRPVPMSTSYWKWFTCRMRWMSMNVPLKHHKNRWLSIISSTQEWCLRF